MRNPWQFNVDPRKGTFSFRSPEPSGVMDDVRGNAFLQRYGKHNPEQLGSAMMNDIGIGGYDAAVDDTHPLKGASGEWRPDHKKLLLDSNYKEETPAWVPETIFHEIAHMADDITNPWTPPHPEFGYGKHPIELGENGEIGRHFADYLNRDDLHNDMLEQQRIERGEAPNQALLNEHPWLKQVSPLTNGQLANPWRARLNDPIAVTPQSWNMKAHLNNPAQFPNDVEADPVLTNPGDKSPVFFRTKRPGIFGQVQNAYGRQRQGGFSGWENFKAREEE